jgi:hypothetical protein
MWLHFTRPQVAVQPNDPACPANVGPNTLSRGQRREQVGGEGYPLIDKDLQISAVEEETVLMLRGLIQRGMQHSVVGNESVVPKVRRHVGELRGSQVRCQAGVECIHDQVRRVGSHQRPLSTIGGGEDCHARGRGLIPPCINDELELELGAVDARKASHRAINLPRDRSIGNPG